MYKIIALLSSILIFGTPLSAADNTFLDYQNYNHGYCSTCNCEPCACGQPPAQPCNPCDPCAPVCGTECGISLCAIAVGVAAVAVAAVIILVSGSGSSHAHN